MLLALILGGIDCGVELHAVTHGYHILAFGVVGFEPAGIDGFVALRLGGCYGTYDGRHRHNNK